MNEIHKDGLSLTGRAAWLLLARMLSFAFIFSLPLLLVRRLSQHEFGVYKQVFLIVGTAITTLPIGFAMSAFYFLPRERERQNQIVFNILLFHILVGGLACLTLYLYPTLLVTLFNGSELIAYAPMIGLVTLTWVVASFLEVVVIANQEAKLAAILIVVSQFTRALLLLAAAISIGSVWALIYAAFLQGVLQTAILLFYLRSRFGHFWQGFSWSVMRMQLSYTIPFGIASLLFRVHADLHNYFVSYQFGAAAYAVYSVGCFNILLVDMLTDSVSSVTIPRVSYLQSLDKRQEIIELIARMMRKLAAVFLPLFIFLFIIGPELITILFTTQYLASWPIFAINLTVIPLTLIATACDPVIRAYAEHRYFLVKVRAILVPVLFIALWLSTKHFGLVGAIGTVACVSLIERVAMAFKSVRILGVTRRDLILLKDVGKLAVAAAAAGLVAALVRLVIVGARPFIVLAVCSVIFSFVYLAAIQLLALPTLDERTAMRRLMNRLREALGKRPAASLAEGDF